MTTPEEAGRALADLDIPAVMAPTMQRIVLTAERGIKLRTPVRTGQLRRSIHGQVQSATRGVVGTNLIYARPVHRRVPFLALGLDDVQGEIERILGEADVWAGVRG